MIPPSEVIGQYPKLSWRGAQFLGNHGGFSGSQLWRLSTALGDFCLKAWPPDDASPERVAALHELLAQGRDQGLDFLPAVLNTSSGRSIVMYRRRLWALTSWLPGVADFHVRPTVPRLAAACRTLAQLHCVWQMLEAKLGACPGVERRLEALQDWSELARRGWRPDFTTQPLAQPWAERLAARLPELVRDAGRELFAWRNVSLTMHPCWCDPWHDHILFTDDRVTGLIDYGSIKLDHAAVDLARLLGSLVGANAEMWSQGIAAYEAVRPLTEPERALIPVLDRTGLIVAATKWLRWLYHDGRVYDNPQAVGQRLRDLALRLEHVHAKPTILG